MNDDIENPIDVLLRKQFEGPVPDDGFCDRVMQRLPARRRRRAWPLAGGALAGIGTCGVSLWSAPIAQTVWRDWSSGELSAPVIAFFVAMTGMTLLALAWTLAEVEDRCEPTSPRMPDAGNPSWRCSPLTH